MSLVLQGLQFSYPEQGFTLSVPEIAIQPGESVALVGPSGSGKTTLLNLIAGILDAGKGSIKLGEVVLSELNVQQRRQHRLRHIGMIFQSFELLDYLDVRDNVLLQARLCSDVSLDRGLTERAHAIASDLGLSDKWRRNVQSLSQGERQRVAVSRALLLDPTLVLADEPTGNLDPDNKLSALKKLIDECRKHQRMLLTVTHDHSLLSNFDRVIDISTLLEPKESAL